MKFVVPEKETERDYLQHQEEEKIRIPSDEEKNITHGCFMILGFCYKVKKEKVKRKKIAIDLSTFYSLIFYFLFLLFYRITNGYLS